MAEVAEVARHRQVDPFPYTVLTTVQDWKKLEAPNEASKANSFPFTVYLDVAGGIKTRFYPTAHTDATFAHLNYTANRIHNVHPIHQRWSYIDQRLRKDPERLINGRRPRKQDVNLCFRWRNVFVVKKWFTFGMRRVEPGTCHLYQTGSCPAIVYLPRPGYLPSKRRERTFDLRDERDFVPHLLKADTVTAIKHPCYLLMTTNKTIFAVDICRMELLAHIRTRCPSIEMDVLPLNPPPPPPPPKRQEVQQCGEMSIMPLSNVIGWQNGKMVSTGHIPISHVPPQPIRPFKKPNILGEYKIPKKQRKMDVDSPPPKNKRDPSSFSRDHRFAAPAPKQQRPRPDDPPPTTDSPHRPPVNAWTPQDRTIPADPPDARCPEGPTATPSPEMVATAIQDPPPSPQEVDVWSQITTNLLVPPTEEMVVWSASTETIPTQDSLTVNPTMDPQLAGANNTLWTHQQITNNLLEEMNVCFPPEIISTQAVKPITDPFLGVYQQDQENNWLNDLSLNDLSFLDNYYPPQPVAEDQDLLEWAINISKLNLPTLEDLHWQDLYDYL